VGKVTATEEIAEGALLAGRYRVLGRLGRGGMATVFLAEDDKLGRKVAIKRLHTDAPGASLRRFKNEARLGAALNHPNFVAVYDTVLTDESALIVMEHVEGSSLAELAGGRRLPHDQVLKILGSVAEALDHAHAEGVVHRDVKPGNILVREDGVAKLGDLGIAKAIGATQITSEGSVIGTLSYMAPERLQGPGGGPESDVYSLAAVAYELLAGQPPTEATSTGELAAQAPPDLRRDWPKAPPAVAAVIERGLDAEPGRRPPSAGRLVEDLGAALKKGDSTERTVALPPTDVRGALTRAARRVPTVRAPQTGAHSGGVLGRGLAIGALAAVLIGAAAIAFGGDGGSAQDAGGTEASQSPAEAKEPKADKPAESASASAEDSSSGAELNDLGFALIEQGRYDEAVDVLRRAVDSFPEGTEDITYAFALFNLGHALRLSGRPEEAIPVLQERLEFPNQRGEVQRELELAMAEAGLLDEEGDEGPGNGNGKAKGHKKD
jgi:eukaryotic-like serine/threonine-protein kinase